MIKFFYGIRRGNYHELSRRFFICIKINTDDVTNREIMRDVDVNEMGERVCKCVIFRIVIIICDFCEISKNIHQ